MNTNPFVLSSIGFTVCGTIFLFLISRFYFSGRKFYEFPAMIYRALIFICYLTCISEILFILLFADSGSITTFINIVARVYILSCSIFVMTIGIYVFALCREEKLTKAGKIIVPSFFYFIIILFFILSLRMDIVPYGGNEKYPIYSVNGSAVFPIYVSFVLTFMNTLYFSIVDRKELSRKNKMCLNMIIIESIIILLSQHVIRYDANDLCLLFTILVTTIYFTSESQDGKLIAELEISKEEAERSNKAQTEFLTSISHEIRTPMNNILGFSDTLYKSKQLTKNMLVRDAKAINEEGKSLLELINNILDISRLESGKETVEYRPYDLSDVIFEVNSNITHKINKDELDFKVSLNENIPSKLNGDYKKICKIIILLLNNVIKQTPYGEIKVSYNGDMTPDGSFIFSITIDCTGYNMTKEMFDIDFVDFMSLGNSAGNTLDSEALGVIIAKKYIRLLGGIVEFRTTSDENTKYLIKISQEIADETRIGNIFNDINKDKVSEVNLKGKKILVVDDNTVNLKLASKMLIDYQATVDTSLSGKDALEKLQKTKYDLIFLDHLMPGMDGITTLKEMKKFIKDLPPVVALTANSSSGIRDEYISYGFSDYLAKPINKRELNKLLIELIK